MTDTVALRTAIEANGLKYKFVAAQLGISAYGLQKKIDNDTEFKVSEVKKLSDLLNLTAHQMEAIFFAK